MVIFGAGASYDSAPVFPIPTGYTGTWLGDVFRPPLTKDLFYPPRSDGAFDAALDAYPQLQTIGASLRTIPTGTTLEQTLAQLQAEAKDIPGRHRELMAVRFYLQQILWTTPHQWYQRSHGSSNYSTVIGRLRDWQTRTKEPVALVTFNYDQLLDYAYAAAFDFDPASRNSYDLEGYVTNNDFLLFKPHGSVNWARRIESNIPDVPGDSSGPAYLIRRAAEVRTTDEFEIVSDFRRTLSERDATIGRVPALAIPMEAKSIFECPPRHSKTLIARIPEVTRLLTIGWRASEHTFLHLWRDRVNSELKIHVVSPGDPEGIQTNLAAGGIRGVMSRSKMGFTEFAEHGQHAERLRSW